MNVKRYDGVSGWRWKRPLIGQSVRRVRDCGSSAQCGGDHRGLDDLRIGCACLACVAAVDIDAVRALRRERNRDRNQLLVFYWNCSIGDRRLVKGPERLHHLRCMKKLDEIGRFAIGYA